MRRMSLLRGGWTALCIAVGLAAATLPARAAQDVVQFGSEINVAANNSIHDAVCFFCSVHARGPVNGDIVVFFGDVEIEGQAKHDVVSFFGNVRAGNDATIGGDLVHFFGGVRLGDNVHVGKDVVVMFGDLRAAETASFGGDRVIEPAWLFWIPFLLLVGLIGGLRQIWHNNRYRRFARGY